MVYSQTFEWINVIQKTYGHDTYRLFVEKKQTREFLNLVSIRHWLFGRSIVSIPFSDIGGIIGNDHEMEKELFKMSLGIAEACNADSLELRMDRPLTWLNNEFIGKTGYKKNDGKTSLELNLKLHKVGMFLDLPSSFETLVARFKSKLRSQVKRPLKEGMWYRVGGKELINEFYNVFAVNMRDLGSPVHSRKMFYHLLKEFSGRSHVIMVYTRNNTPVAGAIVIGSGKTISNPWASSLREYRASSPNMLLYWAMLKFAIENGYKIFDFGRSTPGEGTYAFKKQWGAVEKPLFWYIVTRKGKVISEAADGQDQKFKLMINIWKHLPVSLTRIIGPPIRKYISL